MEMVAYTGLSMPVVVELLLTRDGLESADASARRSPPRMPVPRRRLRPLFQSRRTMGTTSISNSPAIAGSRRAPGPHWVAPHVLRHLLEAMNISANDKENIMALKLVDIDDRLIHGQVATTWIPDFGIESAIIVSDKVANDPVQKSVAGLAAPDIKVSVFGVDKFIDVLKKTELKKATMVLFTNPIDASSCMRTACRSIT